MTLQARWAWELMEVRELRRTLDRQLPEWIDLDNRSQSGRRIPR